MNNCSLEMMALMQKRLDQILQADPGQALALLWQEYRLATLDNREALVAVVFGRVVLDHKLTAGAPFDGGQP